MIKILVIEDEEAMRLLMEVKLKKDYEIFAVSDGVEAIKVLETIKVDLILADVMMPNMNGYDFAEHLRNQGDTTPIIMITAKGSVDDKVKGFNSGIDDYMVKPIDFIELKCRIKAMLRRSNINKEKEIIIGEVTINSESLSIKKKEKILYFPNKEFQILYKLLSYPDKIFTKEELLDEIWGFTSESDETTIRTHINRLRSKIEDFKEFEILTIRGLGYKGVIHNEVG